MTVAHRSKRLAGIVLLVLVAGGCRRDEAPVALGTLEWDRIELVAEASEPLLEIAVREGDRVDRGALVARLDDARLRADAAAAAAEADRWRAVLAEQRAGARSEALDEARALVRQGESQLRDSMQQLERIRTMRARNLVAAAELDRARNARETRAAELAAAKARLALLISGTRAESIAQTEAAIAAAEARRSAVTLAADRMRLVAPRAGRIDSLPFEPGDQPARGDTIATLLVGDRPYARVYIPSAWRARVQVGSKLAVSVEGVASQLAARVRNVANEPSFTPYYALTGEDASRLVYLAELDLDGAAAAALPAGLPVRAVLTP
ncbi:MAG TPA: HlyD family efflux transporter periplasmic adaptor subunit [Candidatus Saccharimonadia bacterium]|nr:HlyD family efflux transporter periplasmic adaptor subunit [Candidatus Saccharimonadia bacterium]